MTSVLRVVAWSQEVQNRYQAVCVRRKRVAPIPPAGVAVLDDKGQLVCAVGLFPCPPYLLADHFVTNPSLPPRTRRLGTILAINATKNYAVVAGLTLRAFVESTGLRILLGKHGFKDQPAVAMFFANLDLVYPVPRKETAPSKPEAVSPQVPTKETDTPSVPAKRKGRKHANPST